MGSGGRATDGNNSRNKFVNRAPSANPPFTLADIKKAIPPHCFNRSLIKSLYQLFVQLFFSFFFYYVAATYIITLSAPFSYVAWVVYWLFQGSNQLGLWIIAHECGHYAFSDYLWLNDTIGYILHTAMYCPYFSWKYTHRRHHANHASIENDQNYVPKRKEDLHPFYRLLNTPFGRLFRIVVLCTIGWPLYLGFNVSSRKYERFANHFDPNCPMFSDRERFNILFTDLGLVVVSYGLYKVGMAQGFTWVVMVYFAPLAVLYALLMVITWLQHTHSSLPHYDSTEWNWLRGALSTIDRDYGVLNAVSNHITDLHVIHHLFPSLPFYHANEATEAIKPLLGEYYQYDHTPIIKAMWREATECFFVEPEEGESISKGVYWFSNKL